MTSPLLNIHGAVAAPETDSPDAGVAWHYGDPYGEQRAAARSIAVIDRSNRGVLAVPGADRLTWLHSLTSQYFTELADAKGTEALVLDPHGHVEHHMIVGQLDETVWLDMERGSTKSLLDYLVAMKFWSAVEPRDATGELAVLTIVGPNTARLLDGIGVSLPVADYSLVPLADGGFARRMPWPGQNAVDLLVPREKLVSHWRTITDAGARPAGSWTFEALRVESLRPRLGVDTDERTIPHEVNWIEQAVHLNKGCYRGQETVAKVANIGRPPRRMVLLHLDGSMDVLPLTGEAVRIGDKVVGRLGSVVRHHELGSVALALLKRSAALDAELMAGEDDHIVQASIDPDSVAPDTPAPGRAAAARLRG